jgi:orotate phosphoribosyltransferase
MTIIADSGAQPAGVVIGLNRQERGKGELSAIQEVEKEYGVDVISIVNLGQVVEFLSSCTDQGENVVKIEAYRQQYGV